MEKYVITISRQYGSFGRLVAKKLSEQLHIEFLDRDIVEETAKRMNTSVKQISREEEITHSKFSYLSYPFGLGTPDVSDEIFLVQQSIIEDFARKGSCIIDAAAPTVSGMSRDFCGFISMHLMKSA